MKNKALAVLLVFVGLLMVSGPMFGHHSDAEFNQKQIVTKEVTVTKMDFVNPHVLIHFNVQGNKGNTEQWIAYGGPPNRMIREGWSSRTVQPGDKLTITGYPSKYDRKIMWFLKVVRANGEVIRDRQ